MNEIQDTNQQNRPPIVYPEIKDCGHAHRGPCPFADADPFDRELHRKSNCGSFICCVDY